MKNNKGITLIALAVTIIVLIILATVGTYSGLQSLKDAKEEIQLSELGIVQHAIMENYTKYLTTKNKDCLVGKMLDYSEVEELATNMGITLVMTGNGASDEDKYYELDKRDLKELRISKANDTLINDVDIETESTDEITTDTYIVNYKTGEVINKTLQKTKTGKPLYIYLSDGT